jgi:hypothetical protein
MSAARRGSYRVGVAWGARRGGSGFRPAGRALALAALASALVIGNVPAGVPSPSVSQIVTLDRRQLGERVGVLDHDTLAQIDAGLRLVLDLVA